MFPLCSSGECRSTSSKLAAAGEFRLDISDAILNESLRVLCDKFHWPEADLRDAELTIRGCTQHVTPKETLDIIQADAPDNRILECAATAQSDYIVTGHKRHILPLGSYRGIPIITVAEFLRLFAPKIAKYEPRPVRDVDPA